MKAKPPAVQAGLFLRNLFAPYGAGYIEIRAFKGESREQSFHELPISGDRLKALCESLVSKSDAGYDVYCGVLPRKERYGKASSIAQAAVIWADFDRKNMTPEELESAIEGADIVVDSGNGLHAYWYMDSVENIGDKRKQDAFALVVEEIQQEKSNHHADRTHDVPRILRVPGTLNWKKTANPLDVVLLTCNTRNAPPAAEPSVSVDTGFVQIQAADDLCPDLVVGSEEWEFFFRISVEAFKQNRLYEAAKADRLPELKKPLKTPNGKMVYFLSEYVKMQMENFVYESQFRAMTDEEIATASREMEFIINFLAENGHAY
jgi:hypothetical protein